MAVKSLAASGAVPARPWKSMTWNAGWCVPAMPPCLDSSKARPAKEH